MTDLNTTQLKYLAPLATRLLQVTEGCRPDMHEPDEQDLFAAVIGGVFDNSFGEAIHVGAITGGYQEIVVCMKRYVDGENVEAQFNLASLVALARIGAHCLNEETS